MIYNNYGKKSREVNDLRRRKKRIGRKIAKETKKEWLWKKRRKKEDGM